MSLAVTTSTVVTVVDGAFLKRQTTSYEPQTTLTQISPIAQTWSYDNQVLYIASTDFIYKFTPGTQDFTAVHVTSKGTPIQPILVCRDKSTLIFAQGSSIHLLNIGILPAKITNTLIGHSTPITSLSLAHDGSLLASSSASGTICVHNLTHNSLTQLKGFSAGPSSGSKAFVCSFHPHTRTRLLIGCGKTLAIYDVSRPSNPVKSISLSERDKSGVVPNLGHIVAISSSPFSKSLTAVAFNSGYLGLVDLEKDKPLLKMLPLKVPLTSMTFSPDGAFVILGTENGKIILKEWRSSTEEPQNLHIGAAKGERIMDIAIQRRIKGTPVSTSPPPAKTLPASSKPTPFAPHDVNQVSPPRRQVSDTTSKARIATPLRRANEDMKTKRTFSPPKDRMSDDEGDISVQMETLVGVARKEEPEVGKRGTFGSIRTTRTVSTASSTTTRTKPRISSPTTTVRSPTSSKVIPPKSGGDSKGLSPKARRVYTPTSPAGTQHRQRSSTAPSTNGLAEQKRHVPSSRAALQQNESRNLTPIESSSRLPTPDLPSVNPTPLMIHKRGLSKPGLTTPDLDRWFEAGQGKGQDLKNNNVKRVGFAASEDAGSPVPVTSEADSTSELIDDAKSPDADAETRSPMTEGPSISPFRRPHIPAGSLQMPPQRPVSSIEGAMEAGPQAGAEAWMRELVNDMVHGYRQETKEEIKGLHLDVLRLGRNIKTELRSLMDEYIGDMKELIQENARLKREIDMLKRG